MRRTVRLTAAAAAVLALSACTASPAPSTPTATVAGPTSPAPSSSAPAPSSSAPAPTGSIATGAAEQRYLSFVQQFSPTLAARDPAVLLTLGRDVCGNFIAGKDADQVLRALDDDPAAPDLNAEDGSVIVGAAVATLCPKYRGVLAG